MRPTRLVRALPVLLAAVTSALAVTATSPTSSHAGTICGTVRDADTGSPVTRAGVFVRTTSGTYTGLHGATDNEGHYCIGQIPAGTYDLEVRVDDYLVAYARGVQVVDDAVDVDLTVPAALALAAPWPNPATSSLNIRFRLPFASPVALDVVDARGRLVQAWYSALEPAGEHAIAWNLAEGAGGRLPPGHYFLRLRAAGLVRTRSFVRVR